MSWTTDFLEGAAQYLENQGVAAWQPTGVYPANVVGIYLVGAPATPDRAIALTQYDVDATLHGHGTQGMQVRCRGTKDPRVSQELADDVFDALHGAGPLDLVSGIHVAKAWRQSHAPIGTDQSGRWETSSNFYLLTDRPAQNTD